MGRVSNMSDFRKLPENRKVTLDKLLVPPVILDYLKIWQKYDFFLTGPDSKDSFELCITIQIENINFEAFFTIVSYAFNSIFIQWAHSMRQRYTHMFFESVGQKFILNKLRVKIVWVSYLRVPFEEHFWIEI